MDKLQSTVNVGDRVRVRQERWLVVDVRPYDGCRVVTLVGTGSANAGTTRRLIVPFDTMVAAPEGSAPLRLVSIRSWRRACSGLLATFGPVDMLGTARLARIDLLPHQLEPALAIVRGLGCRVLIADEVGLGKTIQAGLIASELLARRAADRILVLTPAGLREQWVAELADRFGLEPILVDISAGRRLAAELPVGTNPWSTIPVAVSSFDYVKRPEVLPAVAACRWDVVIVDEAHALAPGSDRRAAVGTICHQAGYVVLLTATPHNGDRPAFESLCAVGRHAGERLLIFRRSRREVGLGPDRRLHPLLLRPSAAERRMHTRLAVASRAIAAAGDEADPDRWLAIAVLHKRAFSSAASLARTVERRLSTLEAGARDHPVQPGLPLEDPAGELDAADEAPRWTTLPMPAESERALMVPLLEAARAAAVAETKLLALRRLVRRLGRLGETAIVFTEYRDTLTRLREVIGTDCAVLHGGLGGAERRAELESFKAGRRRVMLATDAAGEGLNLHHTCRVIINLELPWNPVRLEQRIGRVDRIGQQKRVHVFHLIANETGEAHIFAYLKSRIARARADIPTSDPLEDDERRLAERLVSGADALAPKRGSVPAEANKPVPPDPALAVEARLMVEAARAASDLAASRAHLGSRHSFSGALPPAVAAIARRRSTRRQLLGGWLAVIFESLQDHCGQVVASRIRPLLIEPAAGSRHTRLGPWLRAIAFELERRVSDACASRDDGWAAEARGVHRAFWTARQAREAVLARSIPFGDGLAQAGLFDRRVLRFAAEDAARSAGAREDAERRMAAARAAVVLEARLKIALLLLPRRRW